MSQDNMFTFLKTCIQHIHYVAQFYIKKPAWWMRCFLSRG